MAIEAIDSCGERPDFHSSELRPFDLEKLGARPSKINGLQPIRHVAAGLDGLAKRRPDSLASK